MRGRPIKRTLRDARDEEHQRLHAKVGELLMDQPEDAATMSTWPQGLFQFGWFQERPERLQELVEIAEPEDWSYQHTPTEHSHPVLYNYVRYTYRRVTEENKIALSSNGQYAEI